MPSRPAHEISDKAESAQTNGERQILSINVLTLPLSKIWTGYGARLWLLRYPAVYYRYTARESVRGISLKEILHVYRVCEP
jgi:hypothetical protein